MKRIFLGILVIAALAAAPGAHAAEGKATLYKRLGGYDGIHDYVALVFPRVATHRALAHLFRGHGKDSQGRQLQQVVELVCASTGGPCAYTGREMRKVHDGLAITEEQWTVFMTIISDGMEEKKYPDDVKREFLEVWRRFRPTVVEGK
jgi:hemoglobin